jgi:hypothetical protein
MQRIENRVGKDTPDVYATFYGWQGWIELKVLPAWPRKASTPVRLAHWTAGQRAWARRFGSYGGAVALLVEIEESETLVLFRARDVEKTIDEWTQTQWLRNALWSGQRNATGEHVLDALRRV